MDTEWIEAQWKGSPLGDKRLESRAIKIGKACLATPDGTLPEKFTTWADTKGAYRFFDTPKVSHEALQTVHYQNVIKAATSTNNPVLFIQDGSEILYNHHPSTTGLGPTSDAFGQGIMFHSCLAVELKDDSPPVTLGLAKQTPWIRPGQKDGNESKKDKEKESQIWLDTLKAIGPPPGGQQWISVGDRANDIYDFYLGAMEDGWDFVVRAKHDRTITVDGEKRLYEWMRSLSPQAEFELDLRSRGNKFSRVATLKIAWGKALMNPPKNRTGKAIPVTYLRVYDPEDSKLEWILVTSLNVDSIDVALLVPKIYKLRWIIEEYHKCLKTGCRIEAAQLKSGTRLLSLLGILGVVSTQLLFLRDLSRQNPEVPADEYVEQGVIDIVRRRYKLKGMIIIKELWRRIAMLGGFLGRKSDGEPGWQTIWKGWLRIQDMLEGMEIQRSCG